jgi:hypothetical protein
MKRVLILTEGPTEERFVKELLQPHLWNFGVHPEPKIVTTKRTKDGTQFKGGNAFSKVEGDLRRLLGDSAAALVSTMLDYYGLPEDFPGMRGLRGKNSLEKARTLEQALERHFNEGARFRAFLLLHEFEALLFAKPAVLAQVMNQPRRAADVQQIRDSFPSAEDINDNPATAPSKRVLDLFKGYQKRLHGPMVTSRIGLDTLRSECRHFAEWLTVLESVGTPPTN